MLLCEANVCSMWLVQHKPSIKQRFTKLLDSEMCRICVGVHSGFLLS